MLINVLCGNGGHSEISKPHNYVYTCQKKFREIFIQFRASWQTNDEYQLISMVWEPYYDPLCRNIHRSMWQLLGVDKIQTGGRCHGNQVQMAAKYKNPRPFLIQDGRHSKPTMNINSQHHNLLGNQISPKSEDFCIWRSFYTLVTMIHRWFTMATILNPKWPPKYKNPPIWTKFGFQVDFDVGNLYPWFGSHIMIHFVRISTVVCGSFWGVEKIHPNWRIFFILAAILDSKWPP
jgi:hypothetical protein